MTGNLNNTYNIQHQRQTKETDIKLVLKIPGEGNIRIKTACGFLNHMLELLFFHSQIDAEIIAKGDTHIDYHHITEDLGITIGETFLKLYNIKNGKVQRYGWAIIPMDEALILTSLDISGRPYLNFSLNYKTPFCRDFPVELIKEFWWGFVRGLKCTMHIKMLEGENSHHIIEAVFKSSAKAISMAFSDKNTIQSTKGVLI